MMATEERPGLDERYLVATNSSDLRLNPDRVCSATHLIASGLLGNRMAEALGHLRAEWDAADKPRKWTEAEISARADQLPQRQGKPDIKRARGEALLGYSVAMRHRAHSMAGWLPALSILAEWAERRGVDMDYLSPALYHFLNPVCPVCDGRGRRLMENAPKVGMLGETCHHCNGQREPGHSEGPTIWPRPSGAERIHEWFKNCLGKAQRERASLLHTTK